MRKEIEREDQNGQNKNEKNGKPVQSDRPDRPEVVDNMRTRVQEVVQEYISQLDDPEEIKKNNGLFVDMLKYIYNNYLVDIIDNVNGCGNRYDFLLLDKVFNIYTSLVYQYKQNKRCSILEFTIFTHIQRQTLYNAINNHTQKLTLKEIDIVKRWFTECENTLTNGSSVFEIFLLKSQYRYNDNLAPIPISDQGQVMRVDELPDLGNRETLETHSERDFETPSGSLKKTENPRG